MQHTHMQQRWPARHFRRTHAMQGLKKAASAPLLAQPSGSAPKHQQPPPVLCAPLLCFHLRRLAAAGSRERFERAQGLRSLITQAPALAFVFHSARALKSTEARALRQACPLRSYLRTPFPVLECCIACARSRAHARTACHARKHMQRGTGETSRMRAAWRAGAGGTAAVLVEAGAAAHRVGRLPTRFDRRPRHRRGPAAAARAVSAISDSMRCMPRRAGVACRPEASVRARWAILLGCCDQRRYWVSVLVKQRTIG